MVAKIGKGENIFGALAYNQLKVDKEKGQVLFTHKIRESLDGSYNLAQLQSSFEPYLLANRRTERPVLHISLNPDPKDQVGDKQFREMAQQYMRDIGYGNQPFVVFKHTDIERTHIHIVSICVDEEGRKISDKFEKRRSMDICRTLEQKYNLIPATEQHRKKEDKIFQPVDYKAGDIKSQIASVVRHIPRYYQFQGFGAYNALLSLFNITAEEVKGELHGQPRQGLVYFALNEHGEKASNPFKSSLFGKDAGLINLQKHFEKSKEGMKDHSAKSTLKTDVEAAMHSSGNEAGFRDQLKEQGINTVIRRNGEGRIYGITFIDHHSRTVWNGSQLGKNLSANIFNDCWSSQQKLVEAPRFTIAPAKHEPAAKTVPEERPHQLFSFLDSEANHSRQEDGFIGAFGGLLPKTHGEDQEELDFANKMKKRKKRRIQT
jgi:hypothetical protein